MTETTRTLVLGGGFGGIAAAVELRTLLGEDHEVVVVDRAPGFTMGLRKLWELIGYRSMAGGTRARSALSRHGIRFLRADVETIDAAGRAADTSEGRLEGDHVVVALGSASRPDVVPGLSEHGHDIWASAGVAAAAAAVRDLDRGSILVLVAGAPYPCPPAPYECAIHLHERLVERGSHRRTRLTVATIQPMVLPNAGRAGSAWLGEQLAARDIDCRVGVKTERVEANRVVLADDELPFDLLLAVPPHRAGAVVQRSDLATLDGFVAVDPRTLATSHEGVYAVGDVTMIRLANGMPFPKAGFVAEVQGVRVARAIAAELLGGPPAAPFDGRGSCPIELGLGSGALVEGRWYDEPEPLVTITGPDAAFATAKAEFETERLERWFGG